MSTWGTIGNRLQYDFINEHENSWETRETLMRQVQPQFKNTTKDRKKYQKKMESVSNYFDEVVEKR